MKSWVIVGLAALTMSVSQAQPLCDFQGKDSVFAAVAGDTINLWDIAACAYCSAAFRMSLTVSADSVYIVQTDTAGRIATCGCLFDIRTSISGLSPGTHWIVIYRDLLKQYGYPSDVHQLIKSVQVNYAPRELQSLAWNTFQSGCNPNSVQLVSRADPYQFALYQNFPNPFNPTTVISYQLPVAGNVRLVVDDMLGREVSVLENEKKDAGIHEVTFDGTGLASGVYFYRLTVGSPSPGSGSRAASRDFIQTRKLLLMR